MTDDHGDFLAKLRQIEEFSAIAGAEAQVGSVKNHLRQIGLIARTLRSRLEMGTARVIAASGNRPAQNSDNESSELRTR